MRQLLRRVVAAVPRARGRIVLAVLLAAAASGSAVALMGVSAWLLSRAAEHPHLMYLNVAVVGVRFFGIARGFFRYAERLVGHDVALRMQGSLRERVYATLARTTLLGRRQGDLLARVVADVEAVMDIVVRVLLPFASASLVVLGTSVMLGRFSPLDGAVLLATSVLGGVLVPWLAQRASQRADAAVAEVRGRLAQETHELHRAAVDLVAYDAEPAFRERILATDAQLRDADARAAWVRGLAAGGQLVATGLAVVAALWIGGAAVAAGDLKPRLLAVLALVPLALHEVLADLARAAQTLTRARSALDRVAEVLDAPPVGVGDQPAEPSADGEPGVCLVDVDLGWPGGPTIVRDVNVTVGVGDRVAVTGPSGVGKTTLAATVLGMIAPKSGAVEVRGRVGYLAQDAYVFATTLAENVRIGNKDATDDEVVDALRRAGLGLDPARVVGDHGASLSGGEARRVALARLLVGRFDVWLLDEPTEHLDAETAEALMSDIWTAVGTSPCLVITHDPEVVRACRERLEVEPRMGDDQPIG